MGWKSKVEVGEVICVGFGGWAESSGKGCLIVPLLPTVDMEIFVSIIFFGNVFRIKNFRGSRAPLRIFFTWRIVFCTNAVIESTVDDVYWRACCIWRYHFYHGILEPAIGEVLFCEQEPRNRVDRYTVAVKKNGMMIRHIPRKISHACSLFLRRGGDIHCTVTGRRHHSSDLLQGGVEISCVIEFCHSAKFKQIFKLKQLLK